MCGAQRPFAAELHALTLMMPAGPNLMHPKKGLTGSPAVEGLFDFMDRPPAPDQASLGARLKQGSFLCLF